MINDSKFLYGVTILVFVFLCASLIPFFQASATVALDPLFTTDPTALTKQWYVARIGIPEAWAETTGGSVTVAVVDTGIDGKHEDLNDGRVGRGWASFCAIKNTVNPEICEQKVVREIAPMENSDDNGHGTIVAGIIGAIPNNGKGMAGINWNVRLMPIKVLDKDGNGQASDLAEGIIWAADNGARVINLSIGATGILGGEAIAEALAYAFEKGALVVAAAGNDAAESGINLNTSPSLPICGDTSQNIVLGVAAVDLADQKAKFSNYGSNCIDIAAPGAGTFVSANQKQGLVSTYFDPKTPQEHGLYAFAVGTSVATPIVSGVAALILSAHPDMDVKLLRDRLLASADNIDEGNRFGCGSGTCVGQIGRGRVNAIKALTLKNKFAHGALVRDTDSRVYLIEAGSKRLLSDFVIRQRFADLPVADAAAGDLNLYLDGSPVPPADGTLIKAPHVPVVFLVEDEVVHAVSYLSFISRNLDFSDVVVLSDQEIKTYKSGPDLAVANGVLIKTPDNPGVFVVNNGRRKLLSYFSYKSWGFTGRQIGVVSESELALYPLEPGLYSPPDGTLMLGTESSTVYVVLAGRLLGLNYAAFVNRGYNFTDVKILPHEDMKYYDYGEEIVE